MKVIVIQTQEFDRAAKATLNSFLKYDSNVDIEIITAAHGLTGASAVFSIPAFCGYDGFGLAVTDGCVCVNNFSILGQCPPPLDPYVYDEDGRIVFWDCGHINSRQFYSTNNLVDVQNNPALYLEKVMGSTFDFSDIIRLKRSEKKGPKSLLHKLLSIGKKRAK